MEPLKQENRVFNPPAEFVKSAAISGMEAYNQLCAEAEKDYEGFWGVLLKRISIGRSLSRRFWMKLKRLSINGLKMD